MSILRRKEDEAFYAFSGQEGLRNHMTILRSPEQRNVVIASSVCYAFGMFAYVVLSSYLVYVSFHQISPNSPSYPGPLQNADKDFVSDLGKDPDAVTYRRELYDLGFAYTPDRSDRPWWLKILFVDINVYIFQFGGPLALLLMGRTKDYSCYVCFFMILAIAKGIVQIVTVLPAANRGTYCWAVNFGQKELDIVRTASFLKWCFNGWGMVHGCNDMLWSGHSAQSCIGLLCVNQILRDLGVPLTARIFVGVYYLGYVFAVLACRMHYTVDVFLATLVACLLYTHPQLRFTIWWTLNTLVGNLAYPNAKDEDIGTASATASSYQSTSP